MRRVVRSVAVALSLALGGCLFVSAGPVGAQQPRGSSPAGPPVVGTHPFKVLVLIRMCPERCLLSLHR